MNKSITGLITLLLCAFAASNLHAGAAICIAKEKTPKNNDTDVEYFVRWDSTSKGYAVGKEARKKHKEKYSSVPSCKNTGSLINGYFVVIKNVRTNYAGEPRTTYAMGFGTTGEEAEQDAVKELGIRNWSWKKSEGYTVEKVQQF